MVGALVTYVLFMWDSFQPNPDQYMDEYVFYIKVQMEIKVLIISH